jgi:hypothetical protein
VSTLRTCASPESSTHKALVTGLKRIPSTKALEFAMTTCRISLPPELITKRLAVVGAVVVPELMPELAA